MILETKCCCGAEFKCEDKDYSNVSCLYRLWQEHHNTCKPAVPYPAMAPVSVPSVWTDPPPGYVQPEVSLTTASHDHDLQFGPTYLNNPDGCDSPAYCSLEKRDCSTCRWWTPKKEGGK